jgi:hypothetical protein
MTRSTRVKQVILGLALGIVASAWSTAPAAAVASNCWYTPQYGFLFCNDGSDMRVCDLGGGECTIDCGQGTVPLPCL